MGRILGDIYRNDLEDRVDLLEDISAASVATSLVSGGEFRTNSSDDKLVDLDPMIIFDPNQIPENRFISIPGQTGVAPPVTAQVVRITATKDDGYKLEPFVGHLTEIEKVQGEVQTGVLARLNLVNINNEFVTISSIFGMSPPGNQDMFGTGIRIIDGLGLILNADLTLGERSGLYLDPLAPERFICPEQPFIVPVSTITQYGVDTDTLMFRQWFGNGDPLVPKVLGAITTIDPSSWDDPTIAPTDGAPSGTMLGLEAQNISVHVAKSKLGVSCGLEYGRIKYAKISDAVEDATNQSRIHGVNVRGTRFAGIISLWNGATDMTDPTHAQYTPPISALVGTI